MICPNINDPQVKAQFDELVQAVGKTAAYDIWNQNNGNPIDLAPDGAKSQVFESVNSVVNDRQRAIKIKAKMYGKTFKEWYGVDWSNMLQPTDMIIFGHPGIGKTYYTSQNDDIIDWDNEVNDLRDEFIRELIDPEHKLDVRSQDYKKRKNDVMINYRNYPEYIDFLTEHWRRVTEKARREGKRLFASPTPLLDLFRNDFDKFIVMDEQTALSRMEQSGETSANNNRLWKQSIDRILSEIDPSKLIYTKDYLTDFMNKQNNPELVIDEHGEPLVTYKNGKFIDAQRKQTLEASDYVLTEDDIRRQMEEFADEQYDLDKKLDRLVEIIKTATESRLKSVGFRNLKNKAAVITPLQQQLDSLRNPHIQPLQNVIYCISYVNTTMTAPINKILRAQLRLRNKQPIGLSNEQLLQFQQDYFGMYNTIINQIAKEIFDSDMYADVLGIEEFKILRATISNIRNKFSAAQQALDELTVALATETLVKHGIKTGDYTISDYVKENLRSTEGDVTTIMRYIGAADKMNDQGIKAVAKMVTDANAKTMFDTYEKANKLLRLLNKVGINDPLKLFEYDSDGKKTGYIIREKKYGEFLNNLDKEKQRLKAKYKVPLDRQLPEDRDDRIAFNKELNDWLSNNCERRYTKEYYNLFNSLSEETRNQRDAIQFKIYKLLDEVRDENGKPRLERLTDKQWEDYQNYITQRRLLSTRYLEDGTLKDDLGLRIAQELEDLSKALQDGLDYELDEAAYKKAYKEAEDNLTSEEFEKWKQRYTRVKISDDFWKQLRSLGTQYGTRYQELYDMRQDLIKPYRNERTGEIDTKFMNSTLLKQIRSIDSEMRRLRKNHAQINGRKGNKQEGIKFSDIAKQVPTEAYYRDRANAAKKGQAYYEAWYTTHHTFFGEEAVPNSYYTKVVPKDKSLIEIVPSNEFNILSENSKFVNKKYDKSVDEYYQPNKKYDNKEYKQLFNVKVDKNGNEYATKNKDLWALYQELINTIYEANEELPFLTRNIKYRLPQMSGSAYQYAKADGMLKGILNRIKDDYIQNDETPGMVDRPTTRPDGSPLRMIPTYYINKLEDPNKLTNNIVGAVIAYYKMAKNFKHKNEILADVEVIHNQIKNREFTGKPAIIDDYINKAKKYINRNRKSGDKTNYSAFLSKFIDMNIYGEEMSSITQTLKSGKKVNWTKIANAIRSFGTLLGLGINVTVASVGAITAVLNTMRFAVEGRAFDTLSLTKALGNMIANLIQSAQNIFSNTTNNKFIETMKMFSVGTEMSSYYSHANEITAFRTLIHNWAFGVYSFFDYVIKGTILNSTMQNYRYFDGKFYNREQFRNIIGSNEDADNIWKGLKSSYDILEMEKGFLVIKDPQQRKAFEDIKTNIYSAASTIAATVDGQLTQEQKAQLSANALGAFIFMFRNYIPNLIQERITMKKSYDYNTQMIREGEYRAVARLGKLLLKDANNRKHMIKWYKQLDSTDRGNIKAFSYEIAMLLILNYALVPLTIDAADEDRDDWWLQFAALLAVKSAGEQTNMYNPLDLFRTISSVSSIFNIVNPFTNLFDWHTLEDIFSDWGEDRTIKYGVYKGMTPTERNLIKTIPGAKSIYELTDPRLKRKYYEQMYDK